MTRKHLRQVLTSIDTSGQKKVRSEIPFIGDYLLSVPPSKKSKILLNPFRDVDDQGILQSDFGLQLANKNFLRYRVYTEKLFSLSFWFFILAYFQQKKWQYSWKLYRKLFLVHFDPFSLPVFWKIRIFPENRALPLLSPNDSLTSYTISRNSNTRILRNVCYGRTDLNS